MNKGLSHRVCMGVVFVGPQFALTTGGGLLSAETSEDFHLGVSSKSVLKSSKKSSLRKGQDVTSYLQISVPHWWYL